MNPSDIIHNAAAVVGALYFVVTAIQVFAPRGTAVWRFCSRWGAYLKDWEDELDDRDER